MHRIVAYSFLNVCEKIHQFLSRIKKRCTQKKIGSCFLPVCVLYNSVPC